MIAELAWVGPWHRGSADALAASRIVEALAARGVAVTVLRTDSGPALPAPGQVRPLAHVDAARFWREQDAVLVQLAGDDVAALSFLACCPAIALPFAMTPAIESALAVSVAAVVADTQAAARARAFCPGPVAVLPPSGGPAAAAAQAEALLTFIPAAMRGAAEIATALALGRSLRAIGGGDDPATVRRIGEVFAAMLDATAGAETAKVAP
jgi:hypothetical protein